MNTRKIINVATDFSRFPAGRTADDGPFSGAIFRSTLLLPAVNEANEVVINLDGTRGYGSSFLEEAFGGLVRAGIPKTTLVEKVKFVSNDEPDLEAVIRDYIDNAA